MTQLLDRREVIINSISYVLADTETASKYGLTGRKWQVTKRRITTDVIPRPDVKALEVPGEFVIINNDWSKGVYGDRAAPVGTYHNAYSIETRIPGRLFQSFTTEAKTVALATATFGADTAVVVKHKGLIFVIAGRYAMVYSNGAYSVSQDLGASFVATDAIVWNDALLVGGDSTGIIWVRASGGSWTQTGAVYAKYFAAVEDRLWRAANNNRVYNIGPGDDPTVDASWSSEITVGANIRLITDLNSIGNRLVVSKEEGMFLGDQSAIFPNVLPDVEMILDSDNGINTLTRGVEVFYPFAKGLKYYVSAAGPIADEVGPNMHYFSSINEDQPGLRVTAGVVEGEWIYIATEPSMRPWAKPTSFQKTTDNAVSYTDYTSQVTDNSNSTVAALGGLSTLANGDWFVVGYSAVFYGVMLDLKNINTNASTLTVQYWNGSAWTAMTGVDSYNTAVDYTSYLAKSLARGESILFAERPSDWASSTINGTAAYYLRFSFSATLFTTVDVSECRVLTGAPHSYIMAGRRSTYGDQTDNRYIWFTLQRLQTPRVTAMNVTNAVDGQKGRVLVCAGRQIIHHIFMNEANTKPSLVTYGGATKNGFLWSSKLDGGTPEVNKEFLDVTVRGKHLDTNNTWTLAHRVDESTTLTVLTEQTASATVTLSPRPTGKALQYRLQLSQKAADDVPCEINHIEIRYRELPSYKDEYTLLLYLQNNQRITNGTILNDASTQLSALEALQGAAAIAMTDPIGRAVTVSVIEVKELEYTQQSLQYPVILVQLKAVVI